MYRSNLVRRQALSALGLIGVIAVTAILASKVAASGVSTPSAQPSERPLPSPIVKPTPAPTAAPSVGPVKIDLDTATDHDVSVVIDDQTGTVTGAKSGRAGDGMSVRWFDVKAENVDDYTVRLTWVGLPVDDEIAMSISSQGSSIRIRMVQSSPPKNSDATGFDRALVLTFDHPVSADDVKVSIEDAVD